MKTILTTCLVLIGVLANAQQKEERIHQEYNVPDGRNITLVIDNLFGAVNVNSSSGSTLSCNILKTVEAETEADLAKGFSEINIDIIERNDSIIFHLTAPYIQDKWSGHGHNGRWIHGPKGYEFKFDYEVTLPKGCNLDVQTVDQGVLNIAGVEGVISASHVNGDLEIKGAKSIKRASTVNGDVNVFFKSTPDLDGHYSTINGTINLYCPHNLNASVTAKTMHGSLYSAFDFEEKKPELKRVVSSKGAKTIYQVNETLGIEIGQNGPSLSFETLNGSIYLRKL